MLACTFALSERNLPANIGFDFSGRYVLVTGSSGIGLDARLHLARWGKGLSWPQPDLNRAASGLAAGGA